MNEQELNQEFRERLIRIETKLENYQDKHIEIEKRISKLEDTNTWLTRAIIGQVLATVIAYFLLKR